MLTSGPDVDVIIRIATSALFDQVQKQAQMLTTEEKAPLVHLLIEELDASARLMLTWNNCGLRSRAAATTLILRES